MEIWLDIIGFDGEYQVSNLGRIKSIKNDIIMKQNKKKNGYLCIKLCKNGKQHYLLVHRIVASSFIENVYNKEQVNHKNKIKHDNRLENLEFVTTSENSIHSHKTSNKSTTKNVDKLYIDYSNIDEDEIWININETRYYISNLGKIKSVFKGKEYYMKIREGEYCSIILGNKFYSIHRLVAQYFLHNSDFSKNIVNHINGNKHDNKVSNLEWCNRSENAQKYIYDNFNKIKRGDDCSYSKLNSDIISNIYLDNDKNVNISKKYNVSQQTICDIKKGRSWRHITINL